RFAEPAARRAFAAILSCERNWSASIENRTREPDVIVARARGHSRSVEVTDIAEPLVQPPRWALAFLLLALPCDPMRDAILGDLHEEFLDDAIEHGTRSARARYVRRTVGIAVRALSDAMIWREWVSTGRIAEPQLVTKDPRAALPRVSAAGGFAGFV